ncbi:protein LTV1 homolog [Orussus abietinus]|uniref:protein LTV1 homolog n=1 Tax=Orussus abietinus TaxID=222816 RepID=UPI000625BCD7|nr:protein LTV1 homolog [Orussus abietinus]
MPKGKTKKFIDKRNSVTFHLVHRSQHDPLAADETAPQRVLVPIDSQKSVKQEKKAEDSTKRIEEQRKYGIFFDDDYDYLQHLKEVNNLSTQWEQVESGNEDKNTKKESIKINLPSSVFASNVEEEVGLLNRAAPVSGPRLDWDPDIVAALDDDFDYDDPDNQLEDDFMAIANASGVNDDEEDGDFSDEEDSDVSSEGHLDLLDEERDELHSLHGSQFSFQDEETKSRFTEYSMSSSVMRRNEQLTLLDDKFEKMYAAYDETEIGALDCDEIEGYVSPDSALVMQCAEEFEKKQKEDVENVSKLMQERMKILEQQPDSSDEEDLEDLVVDAREKDKWDCQSILSTYSNIYNHPKLISETKPSGKIKIDPKTGIPKNVLTGAPGKLTAKALAQLDLENQSECSKGPGSIADTMKSTLSVLSVRPKNESPQERRDRKKALREYRKERRVERKANTEAFKEEKKRQEKIMLNNMRNVQGNRIL